MSCFAQETHVLNNLLKLFVAEAPIALHLCQAKSLRRVALAVTPV